MRFPPGRIRPPAEATAGESLRVAYVVHTFHTGGLERCVARLCNSLNRDRFRPMVICLNRNGDAADWIERADVPILEIGKRSGNDPAAVWRLARALREHRPHIVHSHNWGTLVETSLARRWARVPVHVHSEHGQGLHAGLGPVKRQLHRWSTRWAFERSDAVVICADSIRGLIHDRSGYPGERLLLIPNGVEPPRPSRSAGGAAIRERLGIGVKESVVGSVGRLVPVKGYDTAIEAIALLARQGCHTHLVLVGDGPERDRLAAYAEKADVADHVHLAGRRNDIGDWLDAFDIYANSSLSEAMSLGVLEAMAAGLPIVAADVGDNAALVSSEPCCGRVTAAGDARGLAAAVASLLDEPAQRRRLGERAMRRYREHYSIERMAARHADLYREMVSRRSASVREVPRCCTSSH